MKTLSAFPLEPFNGISELKQWFTTQALKDGWSETEINKIVESLNQSNLDQALSTVLALTEVKYSNEEDEDSFSLFDDGSMEEDPFQGDEDFEIEE